MSKRIRPKEKMLTAKAAKGHEEGQVKTPKRLVLVAGDFAWVSCSRNLRLQLSWVTRLLG